MFSHSQVKTSHRTNTRFLELCVDEVHEGRSDLLGAELLLRHDLDVLLPPVLQLEQRDALVQNDEGLRARYLQVRSRNSAVDRLLLNDVFDDGVRDAVHHPNIVRAVQLLRLRFNTARLTNRRVDGKVFRLRLHDRETLPYFRQREFLVAVHTRNALFIESQLERRKHLALSLLHRAHTEQRRIPASERGGRFKPT